MYFSQSIHHILFNVSANQSLYQESFSPNVTLPSHCWRQCDIERKTSLIKALISRNVEQDVMNKLWKVYVTKTVRKYYTEICDRDAFHLVQWRCIVLLTIQYHTISLSFLRYFYYYNHTAISSLLCLLVFLKFCWLLHCKKISVDFTVK